MAVVPTTIFVDGENLSCRYHEMVKSGRTPRLDNILIEKFFVWNNSILDQHLLDLKRINYYTSCSGDESFIETARKRIAEVDYTCVYSETFNSTGETFPHTITGRIIPVVKKRKKHSIKESICDIAIAVDVLRACYRDHSQAIWIISGDGDFLPLVREAMHTGKQVQLCALSSGLNSEMKVASDDFMLLDDFFFEPEI